MEEDSVPLRFTPALPTYPTWSIDHLSPSGPSLYTCPRVDTPPPSPSPHISLYIYIWYVSTGGRISLDGMAARGHCEREGPATKSWEGQSRNLFRRSQDKLILPSPPHRRIKNMRSTESADLIFMYLKTLRAFS